VYFLDPIYFQLPFFVNVFYYAKNYLASFHLGLTHVICRLKFH